MRSYKDNLNNQPIVFLLFSLLFIVAAFFGWAKLQYGFNFLDEGWYMVEGWRLTSGDDLFTYKSGESIMLYKVFNALFFKIFPNISLLEFRKLQFFLTLTSILVFGTALYNIDKQYWFYPLVFSCFIFTGLDPIGIISNLSYYTYPHFFLVLHVSFLILGLHQKNVIIKRLIYVLSGLSLWGISFSILHTSIIIFSPLILLVISYYCNFKSFSFKLSDLCYILIPFFLLWIIFISVYNQAYISSIISSINVYLSIPSYSSPTISKITINALMHIVTTFIFSLLYFYGIKKIKSPTLLFYLVLLSILMLVIISTSFFGLITPYFYPVEWSAKPMWFSSLFISFLIIFWCTMVYKYFVLKCFTKEEEYEILLIIPCTLLFIDMSFFSANGALMVLLSSIPIAVVISKFLINYTSIKRKSYLIKGFILLIYFLPFYYSAAWSDWNFSFFDVSPIHAECTINDGFGKGIKTNCIYSRLYYWIKQKADVYTTPNDYIISYVEAPMVYMIAKRKPAMDDSWINFNLRYAYYYKEAQIAKMKKLGHYPKMAFLFDCSPALYPISFKNKHYAWLFSPGDILSNDPILNYVVKNMSLIDEVNVNNQFRVRCFIDNKTYKH